MRRYPENLACWGSLGAKRSSQPRGRPKTASTRPSTATNRPDRRALSGSKEDQRNPPRGRRLISLSGAVPYIPSPHDSIRSQTKQTPSPPPSPRRREPRSLSPPRSQDEFRPLVNGGNPHDLRLPLLAAADGEGLLRLLPLLRRLHAGLVPPLHRPRPLSGPPSVSDPANPTLF